jgi:hypothetical protein
MSYRIASGVCATAQSFIQLNEEEFSAQFRATDIRNHGDSNVCCREQLCVPNPLTFGWLNGWMCNYWTPGESTPVPCNLIIVLSTHGINRPYNRDACL